MSDVEKLVSDCLDAVKNARGALDTEIDVTEKRLVELQNARKLLGSNGVKHRKEETALDLKEEKPKKNGKAKAEKEEAPKKRGRKSRADLAEDLPKVRKAVYDAFPAEKGETNLETLAERAKMDISSVRQQVYLLLEGGFIKRVSRGTYVQA
jgi:ribosomal protein S25